MTIYAAGRRQEKSVCEIYEPPRPLADWNNHCNFDGNNVAVLVWIPERRCGLTFELPFRTHSAFDRDYGGLWMILAVLDNL
jgi:hypothetical protein